MVVSLLKYKKTCRFRRFDSYRYYHLIFIYLSSSKLYCCVTLAVMNAFAVNFVPLAFIVWFDNELLHLAVLVCRKDDVCFLRVKIHAA